MEQKAKALVYLDTGRYISLESLKYFYLAGFFFTLFMLIASIAGKVLFPIMSMLIWTVLYWVFIGILSSKRVKKTFQLRFLVNGISSVFMSALFLLFGFSIILTSGMLPAESVLWLTVIYILFSVLYCAVVVVGVHKGVFGKINEKSQNKTFMMISAMAGAFIPCTGAVGVFVSRFVKNIAGADVQAILAFFGFIYILFATILGYINFVQYYYCKKYSITCDENGNSTSPKLEPPPKKKKGELNIIVKVLIRILLVLAALFVVFLFIGILSSF